MYLSFSSLHISKKREYILHLHFNICIHFSLSFYLASFIRRPNPSCPYSVVLASWGSSSFTGQTAIRAIVKRASRRSFPPNHYSPPLLSTMTKDPLSDPNELFTSCPLQIPFMGGSSTSICLTNSLMNSLPPSPLVIDHDSAITIDFDQFGL